MKEYDPDVFMKQYDTEELSVGDIIKSRQALKEAEQEIQRRKEEMAKYNYDELAKTVIAENKEIDNAGLKKLFDVDHLGAAYVKGLKAALKNQGVELVKVEPGKYKLNVLSEKAEEKKTFFDEPYVIQFLSEAVKDIVMDAMKEVDDKIFRAVDSKVTAVVNNELQSAVFNAFDNEKYSRSVNSHPYSVLADCIKDPRTLIEFNDFLADRELGIHFEIKEVELVSSSDSDSIAEHEEVQEKLIFDKKESSEIVEKQSSKGKLNLVSLELDKRKMVAVMCPECKSIIYKSVMAGDVIECNCGHRIDMDLITLVQTKYRCDSCNARGVLATELDIPAVGCINCHAPVDLALDSSGTKVNLSSSGRR